MVPRSVTAGTLVKVKWGCGLDSGREGRISHDTSLLKLDGRGIPQLGQGHYRSHDRKWEAVIVDADGNVFTMFWSCIDRI